MAVLDHAVHDRTRQAEGALYGCHSRPGYSPGYWAPDRRYLPDGSFVVEQAWIPNVMSTDCRFDMSLSDQKCSACPWRGKGEAYDAMVRSEGLA